MRGDVAFAPLRMKPKPFRPLCRTTVLGLAFGMSAYLEKKENTQFYNKKNCWILVGMVEQPGGDATSDVVKTTHFFSLGVVANCLELLSRRPKTLVFLDLCWCCLESAVTIMAGCMLCLKRTS